MLACRNILFRPVAIPSNKSRCLTYMDQHSVLTATSQKLKFDQNGSSVSLGQLRSVNERTALEP